MDIGTVVGLVLAVAAIGIAVVIGGGGNVMALVDPTSVFVVIIGAAGAAII